MNTQRRVEIENAISLLDQAKDILESCALDEREGYDNLSEGLQQAERGQAMEQAADALDEAVSNVEDAMSKAQEAVEG
jgi:uncharacterized protein with von Willebrand factor type A (vWA) domain